MFSYFRRIGLIFILGTASVAHALGSDAVDGVFDDATAPPPPVLEEGSVAYQPKGSVEAGLGFHRLTGYPNWNSQFLRGNYAPDPQNNWTAEIAHMSQYDDKGVLMVLGNTHVLNEDWYTSTAVGTSSGGFFLPRLRADVLLHRKLLDARNLVVGAGVSAIKAKDEHRDVALILNAAYYFESPWVLEAGMRTNRSNPGGVVASYYNMSVTYGRDKQRYVSLLMSAGREGYQLVSGGGSALADFSSHDTLLTWREWVERDWGFQVRIGAYGNPFYRRHGGELSLFWDF